MTIEPSLAWLVAALVLAGAELLVPGVFLVFLAVAAAITAAIVFAIPDLPGIAQLGAFAMWSAVAVLIGRRWYRDFPVTSDAKLNNRAARLVGESVTVTLPFADGRGRVRLGDGEWPARGPDLPVGAAARVTAVDGISLTVEPLSPHPQDRT